MNINFNKCIFSYLCIFYSSTKYFHEFQSIFVNFCITDIFVKISTIFFDISDISVKSKYRYIRNYRYFIPWVQQLQFTGHPSKDPNEHLGSFMRMANKVKLNGVRSDVIKLQLFPFSLRDVAAT